MTTSMRAMSSRTISSDAGPDRPRRRGVVVAAALLLTVTCALILGTATGAYADGNNSGTIRINVTVPQAGPGGGNPGGNPGGNGGGSGGLPKTGADLIGFFVVAAALIGGGVTLTVVARRRRHA